MGLATDIADAVVTELNAAVFSQEFEAVRSVMPVHELSELTSLKVTVVPKSILIGGGTRTHSQYDIVIDIGVQKRVSTLMDDDVAALGSLVDEIADYLRRRGLTGAPGVAWVSTENDPIYAPDHLLNQRLFTSVLTLTYRAIGR